MASAAGFKQQCPSCEALVPIRDPDLIGRKIDCPKCKYRFIVEDPADADDAPPKSKKSDDKGAKKPAKAKGKRRSDEDDDDKPSGSKGGSNKVLIGALVGGAALVALIIAGFFLMFGDDSSSKSTNTTASTPAPRPAATDDEEKKPAAEEKAAPVVASTDMVTNLIPPEAEGVCVVKLQNFIRTPVGHAIFSAPGTFLAGGLQHNLGFSPTDIDLYLQGWNFTSNWTFNVIHSAKPFDKNAVIAALKLKPADAKIQDQDYFVADANPWVDALGKAAFSRLVQTSPTRLPQRTSKLGARFHDDQTLVLADIEPLKSFLNVKGVFEPRKPAKTEEKKEEKEPTETQPTRPAGKNMMMSAAGPASTTDFPSGQRGAAGGGAQGQPESKPAETEAKDSVTYLTIQPAIKAMLDRLDAKQPILALAFETEPAKNKVAPLSADHIGFDVVIKEAQVVGAAIIWKDHLTFLMGGDYSSEDGARRRLRDLDKKAGKDLTTSMGKALGTTVEFLNDGEENNPFDTEGGGGAAPFGGAGTPGGMSMPGMRGPGGPPPGMRGPGGPPPGMRGPGMSAGAGLPSVGSSGGGRRGGRGGVADQDVGAAGFGPGGRGGRGFTPPGGFGGPGFGQDPNAEPPAPKEPAKATAKIGIQERTAVMMTVDLLDPEVTSNLLNKLVRRTMIQEKGALDMAGARSRIFELAAATQQMAEQKQKTFPPAAMERQVPASRAGRPYTPSQRISWMAELLPYLGHQTLYQQINRAQSWRDPDNIGTASTLIPQFLNPTTAPDSWWVKYLGVPDPVAATQFVGIAGVGLDAASYAANDPAVADKIGIFGYDRQTNLRDITDGAANTILLAEVPPFVKRAWMAGGGSTAVGVPEKNSVKPFVSTQSNGKKGTMVVMADGSVRFISENVSDEVFKALSTIKGNESVILNREAPKVEPPADFVAEASISTAPSAPVPAATAPDPTPPGEESPQAGSGKDFTSAEGKFKVKFPAGKRQDKNISQDTPIGKIEVHVIGVEMKQGQTMAITYNDFPPAFPIDLSTALDNELFLGSMRAQVTASAPGSKITSEKKVKIDGKDGLELLIDLPDKGSLRDTFLFSGKRQYQILVTGPKDFVEGQEAEAFVKSFKFTK